MGITTDRLSVVVSKYDVRQSECWTLSSQYTSACLVSVFVSVNVSLSVNLCHFPPQSPLFSVLFPSCVSPLCLRRLFPLCVRECPVCVLLFGCLTREVCESTLVTPRFSINVSMHTSVKGIGNRECCYTVMRDKHSEALSVTEKAICMWHTILHPSDMLSWWVHGCEPLTWLGGALSRIFDFSVTFVTRLHLEICSVLHLCMRALKAVERR